MRVSLVLTITVALVIVGGGCDAGEDAEPMTKRAYEAELESVSERLQAATHASVESDFASPNARELAELDGDLADELAALTPPAEIEDVHARLVAGLRQSGAELRELADIVEATTSDPLENIVAIGEVGESRTLAEAARELRRRGYDVPRFLAGG